jgi:hypothetical protein
MSITILQDGSELLKFQPKDFVRVYTLDIEKMEELPKIKYSHTDVIIQLDNESYAMIEVCQGLLNNGTYTIKTQPTDLTFILHMKKSGNGGIDWLKKIIFMTFPNLQIKDVYCNRKIKPYKPLYSREYNQ